MASFAYNKPTIIPCPDCATTEDRDYTIFLGWFETAEDMDNLLAWVKATPCNACQAKRSGQEKAAHQGGRPKKQSK